MSVPLFIDSDTIPLSALIPHRANTQGLQQHLWRRRSSDPMGDRGRQEVDQRHRAFVVGSNQQAPTTAIPSVSASVQIHEGALPVIGQSVSDRHLAPQPTDECSADRVAFLLDSGAGDEIDFLYPEQTLASTSRSLRRRRAKRTQHNERPLRSHREASTVALRQSRQHRDVARSARRLLAAQAVADADIRKRLYTG